MLSKFHDDSEEKEIKQEKQLVVFTLNDQEFGVEIKQAREIINRKELTSIPNAPEFVKGVINLRGEIVPVIKLKKRLNLSSEDVNKAEDKIIIVAINGTQVGMIVDDVQGIIRIEKDNIGVPPKITQGINKKYISGVGKMEEKLLIILDLDQVLSRREVEELEELEVEE